MLRNTLAISSLLSLTLAGCGAVPSGALTTAPTAAVTSASLVAPNASRIAAPSVSVSQGIIASSGATVTLTPGSVSEPPSRQHVASTLQVTGSDTMTDAELQSDAESLGYSVTSLLGFHILSTAVGDTGIVRQTATGYALEVTTGFFTTTTTDYVLTGTPDIVALVAARANEKTKVTGTLEDDGVTIDVSTVKSALSLGFLTNWFTKGKFDGIVKDNVSRLPIANATVTATSATGGFVFTGTTDPGGEFAIKCLEPGSYTLTIVGAHYVSTAPASQPITARHKTHLEFDLTSDAAATPTAPPAS